MDGDETDHCFTVLDVIVGRTGEDDVTFPVEGMDGGSISMLTVCLG